MSDKWQTGWQYALEGVLSVVIGGLEYRIEDAPEEKN